MKKMRNRPLSIAEQELIKMYSLAHMPQKNIAATLGLCRPTVGKFQKRFGLAPHSTEPLAKEIQEKILALAETHGEPFIAAELGIARCKVRKVMHTIHRKDGSRYWRREPELRAIRTALRKSEAKIASEFHVTRALVSSLRRRMWQGSGRKKNPANFQNETSEPDIFVRLLDHIFPEGLPASDDSALVDATSKVMVDQFRRQIGEAIETLRSRSRWTN